MFIGSDDDDLLSAIFASHAAAPSFAFTQSLPVEEPRRPLLSLQQPAVTHSKRKPSQGSSARDAENCAPQRKRTTELEADQRLQRKRPPSAPSRHERCKRREQEARLVVADPSQAMEQRRLLKTVLPQMKDLVVETRPAVIELAPGGTLRLGSQSFDVDQRLGAGTFGEVHAVSGTGRHAGERFAVKTSSPPNVTVIFGRSRIISPDATNWPSSP